VEDDDCPKLQPLVPSAECIECGMCDSMVYGPMSEWCSQMCVDGELTNSMESLRS
jgi:hypothetical protein